MFTSNEQALDFKYVSAIAKYTTMKPKIPAVLFKLLLIIETALFVVGLIILAPLCIPLFIYRTLVKLSAKLFQPDLVQMVPPLETVLANDNLSGDKVCANITAWHIMEGSLSVDNLRRLVQENLILHCKPDGSLEFPEFQQYLVNYGGYLFFKWDRDFRVNNHVRYLEQQNHVTTEENLRKIVSQLTSAGWKKNRSSWEIIVIHNYRASEDDNEKKSVMIFRFHHSLCDAYSYLNFMVKRLCKADNSVAAVPRMKSLSTWENAFMVVKSSIMQPYDLIKMLHSVLGEERNGWRLPSRALLKKFNVLWSSRIQVSTIKEIKREYNVSFQAVLNSVISGAIRRMMNRAGQKIPDVMTVIMPLPLPNHPGGLCIHTSGSGFKLPIGEQNPEQRLKATHDMWMQEIQSSTQFIWCKMALFLGWLPATITHQFQNEFVTGAISSSPGIDGEIFLDTNKCLEVNSNFGTTKGCAAAAFTTLSCFGTLRFVLTIDEAVYPGDVSEFFKECIDMEIASLIKSRSATTGITLGVNHAGNHGAIKKRNSNNELSKHVQFGEK